MQVKHQGTLGSGGGKGATHTCGCEPASGKNPELQSQGSRVSAQARWLPEAPLRMRMRDLGRLLMPLLSGPKMQLS